MPSVMTRAPTRRPARSRSGRSRSTKDEGNRADTTLEGLAGLKPVFKDGQRIKQGGYITAGNASPAVGRRLGLRADGGARRRSGAGSQPLGVYRGIAVAGCEPDEMGIGPVFAVPKLLKQHGLTVDDIDLWELNEAFACQVLYCRDRLGIPDDSSTSTAARSRSAIPTACRARAWSATR